MKGFLQSLPVVGKAFHDIAPEAVVAFWQFMQGHFGTRVMNKEDALEMQLLAQALNLLGVQDRARFLRSFTTTLVRRIYTPFEIGVPRDGWDLWRQVVVCVHEHQHVVQQARAGLRFEIEYVVDPAARAAWEAEAYRSDLELHFWRYGATPSARKLAELLIDYGCRPADVEVAWKSLALSAASVRQGAVMNQATHVALGWLNEHLPHLRAQGVA